MEGMKALGFDHRRPLPAPQDPGDHGGGGGQPAGQQQPGDPSPGPGSGGPPRGTLQQPQLRGLLHAGGLESGGTTIEDYEEDNNKN